jgi:hypothetical protein
MLSHQNLQSWQQSPQQGAIPARSPFTLAKEQDFAPLPTYQETRNSNAAWVQVTLSKTEADGTRTQTIAIAHKVK